LKDEKPTDLRNIRDWRQYLGPQFLRLSGSGVNIIIRLSERLTTKFIQSILSLTAKHILYDFGQEPFERWRIQ
jgi:hypothetical protein